MKLKKLLEETERLYIKTMETIDSDDIEKLTGRLAILNVELNSEKPDPSAALEMAIIGIQLMSKGGKLNEIEKVSK